MARTPTTLDPFNAVAEPKRRPLLEALGGSGRLLSAEFVEYNPVIAPAAGVAATAAGLIGNLFGVKTETSVQKVLTGAAQCSA